MANDILTGANSGFIGHFGEERSNQLHLYIYLTKLGGKVLMKL